MIVIFVFDSGSDKTKFEFLYDKYKSLLLFKANEILRDYALAEDAVSEAFIRIYKNLNKIEDPTSNRAVAFIVTIVKNVALTILKQRKGQQGEELFDNQPSALNLEEAVVNKLSSQEIFALVEALGEETKSVFLLKHAYDMSHRDIGRSLGLSENNVTVKLHRAHKKLSALLAERGLSG